MINYIKHKLAARSLTVAQRKVARDLQFVMDSKKALAERELFLLRYASHLAVKEIELNVTSRRNARSAA